MNNFQSANNIINQLVGVTKPLNKNTMKTIYALFKGFTKLSEHNTIKEAQDAINTAEKGIYNVCTFVLIDGRYRILDRQTTVIK